MRLVVGWDLAVSRWVGGRLGIEEWGPHRALGVADENGLIAGIVYNNYRHPNIEATIASTTPRWCSRRVLRAVFSCPFDQFDCTRLTAFAEATNQPVRAFLCSLGFHHEGTMRRAYPTGADAVIYGMLREECRWLEAGENQHGESRRIGAKEH